MKIIVRKFDPETDAGLVEFTGEEAVIRTGNEKTSVFSSKDAFLKNFSPDGFWLALADDKVVGAILFGQTKTSDVSEIRIFSLSVDPDLRFKGIGGLLMHKADLYADATGIAKLAAQVDPGNAGAMVLFHKCRFKETEKTPESVTMVKYR